MFKYRLIQSERKTISISILPTKEIVVKAPLWCTDEEIEQVLRKKESWVHRKISQMQTEDLTERGRVYETGTPILYMCRQYYLDIVLDERIKRARAELVGEKLCITLKKYDSDCIQQIVREWYIMEAKKQLEARVVYFATLMKESYGVIRIKEQKTRWGSCSSKGNLNFNWHIIMAPQEIQDYLVVHELCHRKEMNHSVRFWRLVGEVLPDYKERRAWLRKNGNRLLQ